MILGDNIYVRTITASSISAKNGRSWQYHSRSDSHSKAACWSIVLDLLVSCSLLREHVLAGKVRFGINHEMRDFRMNRKKNLDLVICTPGSDPGKVGVKFTELVTQYGIVMDSTEKTLIASLPDFLQSPVGSVLVALEAKACMTEHVKACPRLYDELSSSFQTIHGDTKNAVAAAFVTINSAEEFASPVLNKDVVTGAELHYTKHVQPKGARRVLEKIKELPRRSGEDGDGYDALGAVFVECRNDGSEVSIVGALADGTAIDPIITYQSMIQRISSSYTSRFRAL
jgi:hypothetical protein